MLVSFCGTYVVACSLSRIYRVIHALYRVINTRYRGCDEPVTPLALCTWTLGLRVRAER